MRKSNIHLGLALQGAGWHPAAWREPDARPHDLFTAPYWADLAIEAEQALLDFVTIEDTLGLQTATIHRPDTRTDQVRGDLDAVLLAARLGPLTRHIGLIPTANVTHTEPFHLATAIATLDYASSGRAGWRPQISARASDAAHFGRRVTPQLTDNDVLAPERIAARLRPLFDEARDVVEVARRLWDSWEDDAEIRDTTSGRFIDHAKLHHINFEGEHFSVKGPAITPRPPQGQPVVASLAHADIPYEFATAASDVVFVTPADRTQAATTIAEVAATASRTGRDTTTRPLRIFADLVVVIDDEPGLAASRKERLDTNAGNPLTSDAAIFVGTSSELADLLLDWHEAGFDGFRLRPAVLPHDLIAITRKLVPELQRRGLFREHYSATTLRGHLGLSRPKSRFAVA
ncbi:LLM class flavin-dependent oxidoreductase [Rhodococcus sp. NPDC057135]|uniref:LLM class flavin-dependent oxidoreductase n=1 Tax=Rhodococcus sp. NPDC057135 TaxID=3346028 RepID=UPI00362D2707